MMEAIKVKLDWTAYLREFEAVHGEPVVYRGRLLYRDGWTYSMSDTAGPEWPPPKEREKLLELKKAYWNLRQNQAKSRLIDVEWQLNGLEELQRAKSVRLQVIGKIWDEKLERNVNGTVGWSSYQLNDRILMLRNVIAECETNLKFLAEEEKKDAEDT